MVGRGPTHLSLRSGSLYALYSSKEGEERSAKKIPKSEVPSAKKKSASLEEQQKPA